MKREQLSAFLAAAKGGGWHPLWLCLAKPGLRLAKPSPLSAGPRLRPARDPVARALSDGETETPKGGHGRKPTAGGNFASRLARDAGAGVLLRDRDLASGRKRSPRLRAQAAVLRSPGALHPALAPPHVR